MNIDRDVRYYRIGWSDEQLLILLRLIHTLTFGSFSYAATSTWFMLLVKQNMACATSLASQGHRPSQNVFLNGALNL